MKEEILAKFGLEGELPGAGTGSWFHGAGELLESRSPIDGHVIGRIRCAAASDCEQVVSQAVKAFEKWRKVPAPKRGEVVRQIGQALRARKTDLGALVSLEMGKIRVEGDGEVQEMIDMADYAVGLSRMLYGATMPSERPGHRMYEQWHPLGPVGVITAFNFPVAVWAWNAMIALVAGDPVIWKPSSKVPLCALAALRIAWKVLKENDLPEGLLSIVVGKAETVGQGLTGIPESPSFRPPAVSPWAAPLPKRSKGVWERPCWNWGAIMGSSSPPAPTCNWRCGPLFSRPWEQPGSAAPPSAGSLCIKASFLP